ncbi:uncharacterized protein Dvar_02220 [Desulfosarcina variabilis str. Montpellier]
MAWIHGHDIGRREYLPLPFRHFIRPDPLFSSGTLFPSIKAGTYCFHNVYGLTRIFFVVRL